MKAARLHIIFTALTLCIVSGFSFADSVTITRPEYIDNPIRDGYPLFPDSLSFDSDSEELVFPDLGVFVKLSDFHFPKLRKVTLGNVDYMPGGAFIGMPELEEIVITGMVGHFDCAFAIQCPKLKKIIFKGPVSSTGGPGFIHQCSSLDSVIFESSVCDFGLDLYPQYDPQLTKFTIKGAVLDAYNDSLTPITEITKIKASRKMRNDLNQIARWQAQVLTASGDNKWMRKSTYNDAQILLPVLIQLGSAEVEPLKSAMAYAWGLGDEVKSHLDILKESPEYIHDSARCERFAYAQPSDSLLTLSRIRFNLDSVAGNGDDISKIKNLLYWVHDNIRHDGSNGLPSGGRNLRNIYDSALENNCGYNCRALAIALTEALLAEGIPARYLTCESKQWDTDNDCHVICIAWSESLDKWIWVDPTFAAFVTDENGLMLHPGEVRYRLQHDLPLILNPDANWNHEFIQTKEDYLDQYMAKNLYIISCNTLNQAEPEGQTNHATGSFTALVPIGCNYNNARIITTDYDWFWQAPSSAHKESKP